MYVHMYTHADTRTYTRSRVHAHACMICMYFAQRDIYIRMYKCACIHTHILMCMCAHACVCICSCALISYA